MLSINTTKYINSLKSGKFRKKYGKFAVEGQKIVNELINSNLIIDSIFALKEWIEDNKDLSGIEINEISHRELKKISSLKTPNQVLAVVNKPDYKLNPRFLANEWVLVLDNIRDPGNLGTIIRTADWFGVRNIICSPDTVDVYNPKVIQATMGSFIRVKTHYTDPGKFFAMVNKPVFGAVLNGKSIYNQHFPNSGFLIIGNESKGISEIVKQQITNPVTIPSFTGGSKAESLNASIAGAVILSEIKRQNNEQ